MTEFTVADALTSSKVDCRFNFGDESIWLFVEDKSIVEISKVEIIKSSNKIFGCEI